MSLALEMQHNVKHQFNLHEQHYTREPECCAMLDISKQSWHQVKEPVGNMIFMASGTGSPRSSQDATV